jgi:hypothetical protein
MTNPIIGQKMGQNLPKSAGVQILNSNFQLKNLLLREKAKILLTRRIFEYISTSLSELKINL